MATSYWPTMFDYQEAVQTPNFCFSDTELRGGQPVLDKLGLPRPICGMFASVYELARNGRHWAARCFLRNIPGQHDRYAQIAKHIEASGLDYFVEFVYLDEGIRVRGQWFPIVRMEWVKGCPLNEYIRAKVGDARALEALEANWLQLLKDLRGANLAHGDLQHGNVLVHDDGSLKLIDYDGMWVPSLKGETSNETGHPDYQSPKRTDRDFDKDIDTFAGEVIHAAIRALISKPELWKKYDNGDNLLFKRSDYVDPGASELLKELGKIRDRKLKGLLKSIVKACGGRVKAKKAAKPKPKKAKPAPKPKKEKAAPKAKAKPKAEPKPAPKPKAKAKPKKKPAPQPAKGPAWLTDHVAHAGTATATATATKTKSKPKQKKKKKQKQGTQPAPPPAAAPAPAAPVPVVVRTDRPRGLLVALHVVVTLAPAAAAYLQVRPALHGVGVTWPQAVFVAACAATTMLGVVAFATLFRLRRFHRNAARRFFALAALTMVARLAVDALSVGDLLRTTVLALLVLACGGALLLERATP